MTSICRWCLFHPSRQLGHERPESGSRYCHLFTPAQLDFLPHSSDVCLSTASKDAGRQSNP